ncbi:DNA cytosine methyltransferase [Flavonifractor plautii]|uniref:DNA cytosine methyltransferase n=1 Tax=Flavonifractor plautii TaxID=292800 RepID=UPI00210B4E14|nr:DNA cytosine methyltransferase [Flavonifractor plautii]
MTNYKTALFCEFDKYAAESYCAVHGIDPSLNIGDITKADEKSVPDFNTMFGGSPCQDFSIAGKQGGLHGHVKVAAIHTIP